jgi:hypothetical protein
VFIDEPDLSCLRQGDILRGIPFPLLGLSLKIDAISEWQPDSDTLGTKAITHTHNNDAGWVTAGVPVRFGFCAVLTHCCRLELRQGGKVTVHAISFARLRPIPSNYLQDPQRLNALRSNSNPLSRTESPVLDYFCIPRHPLLGNQEWVVDYHQTISLPSKDIGAFLTRKVLQMKDRERMKFKFKYSACVSRPTDEEAGNPSLLEPWTPEQADLEFGTGES